jgi:hypothetical protein
MIGDDDQRGVNESQLKFLVESFAYISKLT